MDYKKIRKENINRSEKFYICIAAVLAAIIVVQCFTIAVLHSLNRKYKNMYDESPETRLEMQKTINNLNARDNSETDLNTNQ